MVIVVLAITTLGRLSARGTYGRMNQAFTASPPTDAVGVVMLNASPASRAASSERNGTASRWNANRQPSVSSVVMRP